MQRVTERQRKQLNVQSTKKGSSIWGPSSLALQNVGRYFLSIPSSGGYTTSLSHYVHWCHCSSSSPPRLCWVWSLPSGWVWSLPSAWEHLWAEAVFHFSQRLKASTKPINSRLPRVICETILRLLSEKHRPFFGRSSSQGLVSLLTTGRFLKIGALGKVIRSPRCDYHFGLTFLHLSTWPL